MGSRDRRVAGALALALLALTASSGAFAGSAGAAPPDFLLQMPEDQITPGSGAAELNNPRGVAADPSTGHVYISDVDNFRIDEYTAWGAFVKAWGWGVADGGSALQTCGPVQPEVDPPPGLCQEGSEGSENGQFARPGGIAVDGAGNVYVFDRINLRVQKFSPAGAFLLMFGDGVNKTTGGDICTQASGDECGQGSEGTGPSQFASTVGDFIDYSAATDTILVGDKNRIQVFELDGTFKEEIPFAGALAGLAGKAVNGLDVGPGGDIYLTLSGLDDVYKLSPAGTPLAPGKPGESGFKAVSPQAVAVDVEGGVYATEQPGGTASMRVLKYDAAGVKLLPTKAEEEAGEFFPYIPFLGPALTGLATNLCPGSDEPGNLYVSYFKFVQESHVDAYGTGPIGCEDPPPADPDVLAQFATSVGRKEATVRAEINPHFFLDTTYYVEYGTGICSAGGCGQVQPVPPANLTSKSTSKAVKSAGVLLEGLTPATTYHYRFVAESGFSLPDSNGPAFGEDPDGKGGTQKASFAEGVERTFRTFAAAEPPPACSANKAFRADFSASLPDCRAYEMVSPLDKEGGDVALWIGKGGLAARLFELDQSAASGERFAFTSRVAFGDPESSPFASQYLAERTVGGWSSRSISAPRSKTVIPIDGTGNEFEGFSTDLCTAWFRHNSVAPLTEDGVPGFANLYRRDICSDSPSFEALSPVEPPNRAPEKYLEVRVQGFSEDGTHSIFTANDKLDPEAPTLKGENELLLYEHTPKGLRFVCYLPSGNPSQLACGAGMAAGPGGGNKSSVHNAISDDGQRIFWTAYSGNAGLGDDSGTPGQIYARIEGTETLKVSGSKASDPASYWTAASNGSKAIFEFTAGSLKDQLYEFDVETQTASLIAKGVEGPMGASEDASRIYFASKEDLDGGGPASVGAHNLYLYEADEGGGGTFRFVMALAGDDIGGTDIVPAPIDDVPMQRSATVSPDGLHVAFTSAASPTPSGYDNLDAVSGKPDQEVYLYDATQEKPRCVSCSPAGARPTGEPFGKSTEPSWVAARIQGWEAQLHSPRVVSDDGGRVFFESRDALVPGDTNNDWDVYQWEALDKGNCAKASDTFSEASEGCVDLISSGESEAVSTFLDADPNGDNVFIGTQGSLVGIDPGLNDVYDARVDGGFPEPRLEPDCEGEACQSPPAPPPNPTPASESFRGPGDENARKSCKASQRRVKRKGKVRCVPKHHRRAHTKRRAVR